MKKYASNKLIKHLENLLGCKEENFGEYISDLRNDIAHVGRPSKLLPKITARNQFKISRALQIVVIGFVLEDIGVSANKREKYQDSLIRLDY